MKKKKKKIAKLNNSDTIRYDLRVEISSRRKGNKKRVETNYSEKTAKHRETSGLFIQTYPEWRQQRVGVVEGRCIYPILEANKKEVHGGELHVTRPLADKVRWKDVVLFRKWKEKPREEAEKGGKGVSHATRNVLYLSIRAREAAASGQK